MIDRIFAESKVERIKDIAQLVTLVRPLKGAFYFRGHTNESWQLLPTIARMGKDRYYAGRPVNIYDHLEQERDLLHRFRRWTYEHRGRILGVWEVLFLARHHGLPVRLMDWTTNPLVALYFACEYEKESDTDGCIWWFKRKSNPNSIDVFENTTPDKIQGVRLIYPFYPTSRMTVQSGIFTIHEFPWIDLRKITRKYMPNDCDIIEGSRWIIPKRKKQELLMELVRFGIHARTLFPELDGVARGLIQIETLRNDDEYTRTP